MRSASRFGWVDGLGTMVLLVGLAGCQSLAQPPERPAAALSRAADLGAKAQHTEALAVLNHFGPDSLSLEEQAHWYLLAGRAHFALGEPWAGFVLYRDFIREHQFLPKIPELADLTYRIGESLAASDDGVWPFYSDRSRGRNVLSEFVSLYPTRSEMPDALHRLGEMAYEDGKFELARERFTQIITGRFDGSVWNTKAAFRVAMCYFRRLEGPEYDQSEMRRAMAELTDFLNSDVKNPKFRAEAKVALDQVRAWLGDKHEKLAAFYRTLGNGAGERHHLRIAAERFPETPAARRAQRRLEQQEAPR